MENSRNQQVICFKLHAFLRNMMKFQAFCSGQCRAQIPPWPGYIPGCALDLPDLGTIWMIRSEVMVGRTYIHAIFVLFNNGPNAQKDQCWQFSAIIIPLYYQLLLISNYAHLSNYHGFVQGLSPQLWEPMLSISGSNPFSQCLTAANLFCLFGFPYSRHFI